MDTKTHIVSPKVVKKYKNRKLYDTETSKYITLKTLVDEVVQGRDIMVVDNVSKADITGQTLLQALVETDADAANADTLRSILRAGGLVKFVQTLKST